MVVGVIYVNYANHSRDQFTSKVDVTILSWRSFGIQMGVFIREQYATAVVWAIIQRGNPFIVFPLGEKQRSGSLHLSGYQQRRNGGGRCCPRRPAGCSNAGAGVSPGALLHQNARIAGNGVWNIHRIRLSGRWCSSTDDTVAQGRPIHARLVPFDHRRRQSQTAQRHQSG